MKTLYLDCFAGMAGDMLLGALIDLGLDPAVLERELAKLGLDGYRIQVQRVDKRGLQAVRFIVLLDGEDGLHLADSEFQEEDYTGPRASETARAAAERVQEHHVHEHEHSHSDQHHPHHHDSEPHTPEEHPTGDGEHHHRTLADILALIGRSDLPETVRDRAQAIFRRLGEAEARVHGGAPESVHFHEVGNTDAILDIVGAAIGLEQLGIEQVFASPVPLGSGFIRFSHGLYPVPAPATAYLLTGVPVYTTDVKGELITPTGAAILSTICQGFGPMPGMALEAVGYGAGSREREFPNVVRAFLGETESAKATGAAPTASPATPPILAPRAPFPEQHAAPTGPGGYHEGPAVVMEANIDDMNPQLYQHLLDRLLQAGALDAVLAPVQMKKNRPGILLQVLAQPEGVDTLLEIIFTEATTIGVRTYPVTKRMLQRETHTVQTPYGPVRVKVARLGERVVNVSPEYEDCHLLAQRTGRPLKEILQKAQEAGEEAVAG